MIAPIHPYPDNLLVEEMVELGCLPPAFTREAHPGLFQSWEDRAFLVRANAASGFETSATIRDCDAYSGQPLPARRDEPVAPIDNETLAALRNALGDLVGEASR